MDTDGFGIALAIFIWVVIFIGFAVSPPMTGFEASKAVPVKTGKTGSILVEAKNISAAKSLLSNYSWLIYPVQFKKDGQLLNGTLVITNAPIQNVSAGVGDAVVTLLSRNATLGMLKLANVTPPNWTNMTGILVLTPSKAVVKTSWYFPWYYYIWFLPAESRPIATYDIAVLKGYLPEEELEEVDDAITHEEDEVVGDEGEGVADEGGFGGEDVAVGGDG